MTGRDVMQAAAEPYLDSKVLATLRRFLEAFPELKRTMGPIARFTLVLDANVAVGDLIHRYKNPHLKQTALEEAVKSSAIKLCAPTWLDREMVESAIPQVSSKRRIPEATLQGLWAAYRAIVIWDDFYAELPDGQAPDSDEKDVPYVALQQSLQAAAILSRDKDIDRLGGKRIDIEFVLYVRSYARAASYAVGIRVGGTFTATLSIALLVQLVRGLGTLVTRLPDWAKVVLLLGAVFVAVHPATRNRIFGYLQSLGGELAALWPEIERLMDLVAEKDKEASLALEEAERLLVGQPDEGRKAIL